MAAAFDRVLFQYGGASAPQSTGFVQNCAMPSNVPVGDYIYVFCNDGFSDGQPTVADDAGNTYTQIAGAVQNNGTPYIFRGKVTTQLNSAANVKITWHAAGGTTYRLALIWSASGIDLTTPLDLSSGAFTAGGFGLTQVAPASAITPATGSIMFSLLSLDDNPETPTIASPFTKIGQSQTSDAAGYCIAAGYYVLPSSASTQSTWTWGTNASPDIQGFADKAASGGVTTNKTLSAAQTQATTLKRVDNKTIAMTQGQTVLTTKVISKTLVP